MTFTSTTRHMRNERGNYSLLLLITAFVLAPLTLAAENYDQQKESPVPELVQVTRSGAPKTTRSDKKDWTFIVYIAADNDLRSFAARNIKQMSAIGSSQHINIVAQLDICISGNKKITRRYYIDKNQIFHVNADDPSSQKMDSGDPNTLISCCKWAIENYPAENYGLVFWNHGTGPIDPTTGRVINPSELFAFNPNTRKLELDRSIGFLDFINANKPEAERGICWDDTTGNYLTNQKLDFALSEIHNNILNGQKFSIIAFDACLMSMIEIANIVKNYADIMVGSQEVELGTGWNYKDALAPFANGTTTKFGLAKNIVEAYRKNYGKITNDYTQSAINLAKMDELEQSINTISQLLIECLKNQKNNSVKNALQASRNKLLCTHFDEPTYIDLHHFLSNLISNLKRFNLKGSDTSLTNALHKELKHGCELVKKSVISNAVGKNLSRAEGLSIYFPDRRIHSSYRKTKFAATNQWINLLTQYLLL